MGTVRPASIPVIADCDAIKAWRRKGIEGT